MSIAIHTPSKTTRDVKLTPAWTSLRYHPIQRKLWTTKHRIVKVTAGRISGKTTLARRRVVSYLPVKKPWSNPRYFYALPTYGWARSVAWEQISSLVPKHWIAKMSESTMVIRTIFGSTLYVLGTDKPSRIEGVEWDGGVIDESSDQKPGVYTRSIAPALSSRQGWCWRIGAPKRYGNGGEEFKRAFEEGEVDGSSFTWPSSDILPEEEIERLRLEMDEKDFAEQIGGRFQDTGGSAYYSFSEANNVKDLYYNPNKTLLVFSDFNVDPMAWCVAHFTDDAKGLEVFDEIWLRDTNTQAALDCLWNRYGSQHKSDFIFVGDPAARQRRSSATSTDYKLILNDTRFEGNARVRYDKAAPAIKDRLTAVNKLLKNAAGEAHLWVDRSRCRHLISDFKNRVMNPDGTPKEARPGHAKDSGHMSDALGYGVWKFFPVRYEEVLKSENLVVFG